MIKSNSFWQPVKKQKSREAPSPFFGFNLKPQKVKSFSPVNLKNYPVRTKSEIKLIDRNPFGDRDKDKVPNFFDCKPLNRKKQGKFSQNIPLSRAKYVTVYHGTQKKYVPKILKEGLKPGIDNVISLSPSKEVAALHAIIGPEKDTKRIIYVDELINLKHTVVPSDSVLLKVTLPKENVKESMKVEGNPYIAGTKWKYPTKEQEYFIDDDLTTYRKELDYSISGIPFKKRYEIPLKEFPKTGKIKEISLKKAVMKSKSKGEEMRMRMPSIKANELAEAKSEVIQSLYNEDIQRLDLDLNKPKNENEIISAAEEEGEIMEMAEPEDEDDYEIPDEAEEYNNEK